jgi:hypothetical protein
LSCNEPLVRCATGGARLRCAAGARMIGGAG